MHMNVFKHVASLFCLPLLLGQVIVLVKPVLSLCFLHHAELLLAATAGLSVLLYHRNKMRPVARDPFASVTGTGRAAAGAAAAAAGCCESAGGVQVDRTANIRK
jgi:hypothetical protein